MREFQACGTKVGTKIHLYDVDLFIAAAVTERQARCGVRVGSVEYGAIGRRDLCANCTANIAERLEARDIGVARLDEIPSTRNRQRAPWTPTQKSCG